MYSSLSNQTFRSRCPMDVTTTVNDDESEKEKEKARLFAFRDPEIRFMVIFFIFMTWNMNTCLSVRSFIGYCKLLSSMSIQYSCQLDRYIDRWKYQIPLSILIELNQRTLSSRSDWWIETMYLFPQPSFANTNQRFRTHVLRFFFEWVSSISFVGRPFVDRHSYYGSSHIPYLEKRDNFLYIDFPFPKIIRPSLSPLLIIETMELLL